MSMDNKINSLKSEFPSIRVGSEETGYTELIGKDYDDQIAKWAENVIAQEQAEIDQSAKVVARLAILEKLGITAEEAALLVS